MSGENHNGTTPPPAPPVYTIYPAGFQGNINYGFQNVRPEDSPPKYEDVISGEYLKSNYSSCNYPSTTTTTTAAASTYQPADYNAHCTCPRIYTAHPEHSFDDDDKAKKCSAACTILVLFFVFVFIILRIILYMSC